MTDKIDVQLDDSIITEDVLKSYSKCIVGIYLACTKGRKVFEAAPPVLKGKEDAFYSSIVDLMAYACYAYKIDIRIFTDIIGYAMNKMLVLRDYIDENGIDVGKEYRNTMDMVEGLFDCTREESAYRTGPYRYVSEHKL